MNENEQSIRCIERVYEIRRGPKVTIVRAKIEKIKGGKGRYRIIDRDIYKDDKEFSKKMETLMSGGKLTLSN